MVSEQITYVDEQAEQPSALEDTEIARIMKLVSESSYKKSEGAPTRKKQEFKPRTLVEIAMEAQRKLDSRDKQTNVETENTPYIDDSDPGKLGKKPEETDSNTSQHASERPEQFSENTEKKDAQKVENEESLITSPMEKESEFESIIENSNTTETLIEDNEVDKNEDFSKRSEEEASPSRPLEDETDQYEKGYGEGLEAGKTAMKNELEQKIFEQEKTLAALISSLTKMDHAEIEQLEKDIKTAILALASERAGIAIIEMPKHFLEKIEKLISRLGNIKNDPVVKLNKDDLNHLKIVKEKSEILAKIKFIEDETLKRGDVIVSTGGIEIEDILEKQASYKPQKTSGGIDFVTTPTQKSEVEISDSSDNIELDEVISDKVNETENDTTQKISSDELINPDKITPEKETDVKEEKEQKSKLDIEESIDPSQEPSQ